MNYLLVKLLLQRQVEARTIVKLQFQWQSEARNIVKLQLQRQTETQNIASTSRIRGQGLQDSGVQRFRASGICLRL